MTTQNGVIFYLIHAPADIADEFTLRIIQLLLTNLIGVH